MLTREERRERVARAIWEHFFGVPEPDEPIGPLPIGDDVINPHAIADRALAALDALMVEEGMVVVPREPTKAMRDAGTDAAPESGEDDSGCNYFYGSEVALDVYRAMIGAFEQAK
jgi:hypothetical protein